jgi:hypothetical protein
MRRNWRFHGARFVAFALVAVVVFGEVTKELWNALMPALFHLPYVSFLQALGLLILSRLLLGGFRGPGGGRWRKPRFVADMTPEERERFRESFRQRHCGDRPDTVRS